MFQRYAGLIGACAVPVARSATGSMIVRGFIAFRDPTVSFKLDGVQRFGSGQRSKNVRKISHPLILPTRRAEVVKLRDAKPCGQYRPVQNRILADTLEVPLKADAPEAVAYHHVEEPGNFLTGHGDRRNLRDAFNHLFDAEHVVQQRRDAFWSGAHANRAKAYRKPRIDVIKSRHNLKTIAGH